MLHQAGFAARAGADARVLVLGSLPGRRSIEAGEYYAHAGNAFWRIMQDLFGVPATLPYEQRCRQLNAQGVALWDVLTSAHRRGSLDAAIDPASAMANDFEGFFAVHRELELLAFNGRKAAELFRRFVLPGLGGWPGESVTLPSTSPAHAAMPYGEKLRQWSRVKSAAARTMAG